MPKHFLLLGALLALALQGCTVSRLHVRQAQAIVADTTPASPGCSAADPCARPSPVLAAAEQAMAQSTPDHPQHIVTLRAESED
jgi:hypothetical protein